MLFLTRLFSLAVAYLALSSTIAHAVTWEELYSTKAGEIEIKIELRKRSFKKRLTRGETTIQAHLRTLYKEGKKTTTANADHEIHCASRKVFRSNLEMETTNANGTRETARVPSRKALEHKELQDFDGVVAILCAR